MDAGPLAIGADTVTVLESEVAAHSSDQFEGSSGEYDKVTTRARVTMAAEPLLVGVDAVAVVAAVDFYYSLRAEVRVFGAAGCSLTFILE